jgi:hypothetical protein
MVFAMSLVGHFALRTQATRVQGTAVTLVAHPSRDVTIRIDDRWGAAPPTVDQVDDESDDTLSVRNHDVQPRDAVALLDFELPRLPEGAKFVGADLQLYAEGVSLAPDQPTRDLWATGNAAAWDPATLVGQPVPPETGGSRTWREPRRDAGWVTWDVTPWVAAWYGGAANYGLRVKPSQHIISDHYYYYYFSSREGPHPPELVIHAELPGWRAWLPLLAVRAGRSDIDVPPTAQPTVPPTPTGTPSGTATAIVTEPATMTPASTTTATATPTMTRVTTNCGTIETFADGRQPVTELHVSTQGSDTTGDGSAARPFGGIARASRAAGPGTAIRVHAGTYPGGQYLENLRGSADAPVWIGGALGEARPLIDGGSEALHLSRVSYVVLHDLEVARQSGNGINIDDGGDVTDALATHHVVVRDVDIHQIGGNGNQDCLKLSGVNDFHVLDSSFRLCGGGMSGSGIDIVGGHHGLIARSQFTDLSGNAVQAKGGSVDIEVRANRMQNAGARAVNMGGSTGFDFFRPPLVTGAPNAEARDIRVVANLIQGSQSPVAYVGCVGCLVANNTLVDPERWVLRILQETTTSGGYTFEPARDGRFVNNLVYFTAGRLSTAANVGGNTAPETFQFAHNLWYAHDDPSRSRPQLPVAEVGSIVGRDPAFTSGFAIGAGSPAAGAGDPSAGVRADLTGACYASPPSIGAYEVER